MDCPTLSCVGTLCPIVMHGHGNRQEPRAWWICDWCADVFVGANAEQKVDTPRDVGPDHATCRACQWWSIRETVGIAGLNPLAAAIAAPCRRWPMATGHGAAALGGGLFDTCNPGGGPRLVFPATASIEWCGEFSRARNGEGSQP